MQQRSQYREDLPLPFGSDANSAKRFLRHPKLFCIIDSVDGMRGITALTEVVEVADVFQTKGASI